MKLRDYVIENFDGGLVQDKSDFTMDRNEFKNTLNLDLEERGKLKRRRGSYQYGQTVSGKTFDDSYVYITGELSAPILHHLVVSRETNGVLYRLEHVYLTAAITTATTTVPVVGTGTLTATGTVEIEGDLVAYTGVSGTTLTGCTGIRKSHPINAPVTQLASVGNTGMDTRFGVYFTVVNKLLIINGRAGSATFDGTSVTAISDADEAGGIFATTYRNRMYVAGAGVGDASGTRNGNRIRVSFSNAGDATNWTITDYFDVEDDSGEMITGLKVGEDTLLIFKLNSIWTYDEVQLKQRESGVGAYNNKVIQKIGKLFYTFNPTGVHVTNGYTSKKISKPVEKYLENFRPTYDSTDGRVVTNCFAGTFDGKYLLYIKNITKPETLSDVVLVYDTIKGNWTVYDGFTNFIHFGSFNKFGTASQASTTGLGVQSIEALFAGSSDGKYYRLFEDTFYILGAAAKIGGDVIPNLVSDSAGSPISTVLETPFLPLGSLDLKNIGYITAIVEQGDFDISYRLRSGNKTSDPVNLGSFGVGVTNKKLKEGCNEGESISLRVVSNTLDVIPILNVLVVRDIETLEKVKYG